MYNFFLLQNRQVDISKNKLVLLVRKSIKARIAQELSNEKRLKNLNTYSQNVYFGR